MALGEGLLDGKWFGILTKKTNSSSPLYPRNEVKDFLNQAGLSQAGKFADLKSRLICNFLEKASATELMTPESSGILPAEATLSASVENDTKQARGNWVVGSQHDMGLRWFGNMVMTCHHTHKQQV